MTAALDLQIRWNVATLPYPTNDEAVFDFSKVETGDPPPSIGANESFIGQRQ